MAGRSLRQRHAALKFVPVSTPHLALFDTLRNRAGSLHASGNGLWHLPSARCYGVLHL